MFQVSLSTFRSRSQNRIDMSSSNFISTSEWNTYINSAISQLLMLINANDADYGLTSATVAMNGTDQFFPVPTDFFSI